MSREAKSVLYFTYYLFPASAALALVPNLVLMMLGEPPTEEPWVRVLGIVGLALAYYYWSGARHEQLGFIRATVLGRAFAGCAFERRR